MFRHKCNSDLVDHAMFVIYYTHPDSLNPVCGDSSQILVFRKSRAGGCLLNLHSRDIHMAKAVITLYVTLYSILKTLLSKRCQASS